MRRLIYALVVAPILLVTVAARSAAACSCAAAGGCGADAAVALFVGRILDVRIEGKRQIARFEVERAAKGARAGQVVAVHTGHSGTSCDLNFAAGQRWLIAAHAQAPLSVGACGGSSRIGPGDAGPQFLTRGDIAGRLERWIQGGNRSPAQMAGIRVWIETAEGLMETRTDKDGWFLLRNVPLRPAQPLRFDVGPRLRVPETFAAPWTPEACKLLRVVAQPAEWG
jgi:hypothetical protein